MRSIREFTTLNQVPYEDLAIGMATTPVGSAVLAWDRLGIRALSLNTNPIHVLDEWLMSGYSFERRDFEAQELVANVFTGQALSLPIVVCGTEFQRNVWRELMKLKVGQTVSYGQLASRLGKPSAARAVGGAVGANQLGFLVPCHRVVREDGVIGQFRWGTDVKAKLLAWESRSAHG